MDVCCVGIEMPDAAFLIPSRTSRRFAASNTGSTRQSNGCRIERFERRTEQGDRFLPNIKSAKKWVRASESRRTRNLNVKSALKSAFKKAAIAGASAEVVLQAVSAYDKAAARGIIHKNKANRKKSRLAKRASKKT